MGLIHEKNAKKSRDTATLKCCFLIQTTVYCAEPYRQEVIERICRGLGYSNHEEVIRVLGYLDVNSIAVRGTELNDTRVLFVRFRETAYPDLIKENPDPDPTKRDLCLMYQLLI